MATVLRAKRHRREGHHGITVARSPLVTSSTPAVWAHVVCSGRLTVSLSTTLLAHTPTGCGHGGTRNMSTSRRLHTRSVSPAAMAGVRGRHCLAEPLPWVGSGWGNRQAEVVPAGDQAGCVGLRFALRGDAVQ